MTASGLTKDDPEMIHNQHPISLHSFPCIDSHIHLCEESDISRLAWTADLPSDHILKHQFSVSEYAAAQRRQSVALDPESIPKLDLKGFIFLETDRISSVLPDGGGWDDVLEEVRFVSRVAEGALDDDHHNSHQRPKVLGMVPWAPLPAGAKFLDQYLDRIRLACINGTAKGEGDETFKLIKGFRFLVQDKPLGTMLQPAFIEGLHWLRNKGYVFDLGIDTRSGGVWQLEEAYQMLSKLSGSKDLTSSVAGRQALKVVVNHFCKPNFRIEPQKCCDGGHTDFLAWKAGVARLANIPGTFMKLSGFLSELPEQTEWTISTIKVVLSTVRPWVKVVLTEFGPDRVMFGSDWPVCVANGSADKAWKFWVEIVSCILDDFGLNDQQKLMIWSGTAQQAYGVAFST